MNKTLFVFAMAFVFNGSFTFADIVASGEVETSYAQPADASANMPPIALLLGALKVQLNQEIVPGSMSNADMEITIETPTQVADASGTTVGNDQQNCHEIKGEASDFGYGGDSHNTASGMPLGSKWANEPMVAMRYLPLGSIVHVKCGGKEVAALVADRGPFAHHRVIDVTTPISSECGFYHATRNVVVTYCGEKDLVAMAHMPNVGGGGGGHSYAARHKRRKG